MVMIRICLRPLFYTSHNISNSFRNVMSESTQFYTKFPKIYSKTWTKSEIIRYIKNNIVYETDDYIASSVPHGILLKKTSRWLDTIDSSLCDTDFNEILEELPIIFNSEFVFLTQYPTSNASGLVIFSKSLEAHRYLKKNIILASSNKIYTFSYLVVVLGCPEKFLTGTFAIRQIKIGDKYGTEILEKWNDSIKIKKLIYHHEVLASSEHVSLVNVKVSDDRRNCVRHILATKCTTPVLGDSYNFVKKNSNIFGVPVSVESSAIKDKAMDLDPELLSKLQLKSGAEKLIPIHVHKQGIKVPFKKKREFSVCVPPPESFVWTCHQLGLNEIDRFLKIQ